MAKKKNIVFTDERRELLTEFIKKYRRPLDYYAYKYCNSTLTKEDLYGEMIENIAIYYSDPNNKPIEHRGVCFFIDRVAQSVVQNLKTKARTNIFKTKLVQFVDNQTDSMGEDRSFLAPVDEDSEFKPESMDTDKRVMDLFTILIQMGVKSKHIDIFYDYYINEEKNVDIAKKYNVTDACVRDVVIKLTDKLKVFYGIEVKKEKFIKRVMCLETNEIFKNVTDASEKTGIASHYIRRSCKMKTNNSDKLNFRFID